MTRALICVDLQVDFCEGGSLAVAGGAEVAAKITDYINAHGNEYDVIVATKDFHQDPGDHFSDEPDFVSTWPPHCVAGTDGVHFHPNFNDGALLEINGIFRKGRDSAAYSGFEGENLAGTSLKDYLDDKQVSHVDVVGIATDYCVKATAIDAAKLGYETTVILDLTAAVAEDTKTKACVAMHGAGVTMTLSH